MRFSKWFGLAVVAAGMMVSGAQAKAADRYDARHDYQRTQSLRNEIAVHRARLNEALRHGRRAVAAQERRIIERDEALLRAQYRDNRHDR